MECGDGGGSDDDGAVDFSWGSLSARLAVGGRRSRAGSPVKVIIIRNIC